MNPVEGLRRAWRWSLRQILSRWVRLTIKSDDASATRALQSRSVCYVLEHDSQTDLAVLTIVCAQLGLPRPEKRLLLGARRAPRYVTQLLVAAIATAALDIDFVPVAIFWGRAPNKEASLWRLLFAEDWVLIGRFRKMLNVLVNGRNTLVHIGEPIRLSDALSDDMSAQRSVRWILRNLRMSLRAQRASAIGPDLSHRRTLVAQLLKTSDVRVAVRHDMQARGVSRRVALIAARKYAIEIAANYSQIFVRFMSAALGWLWNRLYDGVEFAHVEKMNEIGDGAEIIYVPCHRSHMDYLLLSYVIYRNGFAVPHVAAGINLNLPVIGRFLRMGGAFFLRRSFKGDILYAAVFAKYLSFMMARGHPLEYFIEGGRSRTGRLLVPRTGMLSMTMRAYIRHPRRPVVFMPVYFGYERIVEGRTYIGELSGLPKEKESVLGLVKAVVSVLCSKLGKVHVNLGQPIVLDEVLSKHDPNWRHALSASPTLDWLDAAVSDLATRINIEINAAAAVTPINLVALAILSTPRQALPELDLVRQIQLYQQLLRESPYGSLVTVPEDGAVQMIRYAETLGILDRQPHPLGDIMRMSAENTVLATYYRNNVLHLFAMPSLLACCFISNASMRTDDIHRLVWRVYPYIAAELFLRWDEAAASTVADRLLETLARLNLLQANADRSEWQRPAATSLEAIRLSILAQATIQILERYYLVVAVLLQAGSGSIAQHSLEERCYLMAQRMSVLYGVNSPEFFDKSLFRRFIDLLHQRNVVQVSADDCLLFGEALLSVVADAQLVLSEQIRHSILQVTLGR